MPETLRSILCGVPSWYRDSATGNFIAFRENGTGDLQCTIEFWKWIAAEFTWRSTSPKLDSLVEIPSQGSDRVNLGEADIELTLTTKRIALYETQRDFPTNQDYLHDGAFEPRNFTISLEKGSFTNPLGFNDGSFQYRLLFDPSPYPPRSMWKQPERGPDGNKFWEWKDFVGRELKSETNLSDQS